MYIQYQHLQREKSSFCSFHLLIFEGQVTCRAWGLTRILWVPQPFFVKSVLQHSCSCPESFASDIEVSHLMSPPILQRSGQQINRFFKRNQCSFSSLQEMVEKICRLLLCDGKMCVCWGTALPADRTQQGFLLPFWLQREKTILGSISLLAGCQSFLELKPANCIPVFGYLILSIVPISISISISFYIKQTF